MKIALCICGLVGGTSGKDGKGEVVDFELCYKSYKKTILDINNVDVFIHSWSVEHHRRIVDLYKPKLRIFENQKFLEYKNNPKSFDEYINRSRFYSTQQVVNLKKLYETKNNFKYDWVMISRFDLMFFNKIIFNNLDKNFLYASHFNDIKTKYDNFPNKSNQTPSRRRFLDMWFIGNSKLMDEYGNLYSNYSNIFKPNKKGVYDPHAGIWNHFSNITKNKVLEKTKFMFYRYFDYELYRNLDQNKLKEVRNALQI